MLGDCPTARGQFADHPVRLQRIRIPGLGPALLDTGADGLGADTRSVFVEEVPVAPRLVPAALHARALDGRRRVTPRVEHDKVHAQLLPARMVNPFSPTRRVV